MINALVAFIVLFGAIKLCERQRDDLDNFAIATAAVVPVLIVFLLRIVLALTFPDPTLTTVLPPIVLIGATFGLLWKNLEIPAGRAALYTVLVVLVNDGLGFLLMSAQT